MAKPQKPRVVAELGRPETAEETAARKAENSRLHRQRQTVNNLVLSLLASLGMVLLIVLIVPRGTGDFETRSVDVQSLAQQAAPSAGQTLVAPDMGEGWLAKQAMIRTSRNDRVTHWFVSYTTPQPEYQFAAVVQAFSADLTPANETWVAETLERQIATGTITLDGTEWVEYDHPDRNPDETNMRYGLVATIDTATIVVYGTADRSQIQQLATAALASLN